MDVESALMTLLDDLGYTVTSTPADMEARLPVIRVRRVGGPGDEHNDFPRVSIQAHTKASSAAPRAHFELAADIEDRMWAKIPGAWINGVCFDRVDAKESGPVELFHENPRVRVAETVWRLAVRR